MQDVALAGNRIVRAISALESGSPNVAEGVRYYAKRNSSSQPSSRKQHRRTRRRSQTRAATITGATAKKPRANARKTVRPAPRRRFGKCVYQVRARRRNYRQNPARSRDGEYAHGGSAVRSYAIARRGTTASRPWRESHMAARRGGGDRPSAVYARGVSSLATAATDMEAVTRTQPRVKQPVQHYVISLNERESAPN